MYRGWAWKNGGSCTKAKAASVYLILKEPPKRPPAKHMLAEIGALTFGSFYLLSA